MRLTSPVSYLRRPVGNADELLLALLPLWYGCEPDGPEAIEDYDVVVTNHDSSFNFATVRTYYLLDSVVHATEPAGSFPMHKRAGSSACFPKLACSTAFARRWG